MADVIISVQELSVYGVAPEYTEDLSLDNTYKFQNNGRVFLHFKKTGAGDATISIVTGATVSGLAVEDRSVTIPELTGDIMIGPFYPPTYNNSGYISFTANEITGLSVAAIRI